MRVLAIDPGYERMGVAVIDKTSGKEILVHSGCLVTSRSLSFGERLVALGQSFEELIAAHQPELVALEKLFFTTNQKTASAVSEVRGMLLYLTSKHGLKLAEYTPQEVKGAVAGYGKASKEQVTAMVSKLITLPPGKRLDDEYDAIAIGLTALARASFAD